MLNRIIAFILLVFLSPIMLIIAIIIKLSSKGKIIYKQQRIGKNQKIFVLYKFRTMYENADKKGVFLCKKNDENLTKTGKILKGIYLDELPQLYNIIKGDMNFIGPRPEMLPYHKKFKKIKNWEKRTSTKPGITGLAQLNNACSKKPKKKLEYDLKYIKNKSFFLNVKIILETCIKFFQHLAHLPNS